MAPLEGCATAHEAPVEMHDQSSHGRKEQRLHTTYPISAFGFTFFRLFLKEIRTSKPGLCNSINLHPGAVALIDFSSSSFSLNEDFFIYAPILHAIANII